MKLLVGLLWTDILVEGILTVWTETPCITLSKKTIKEYSGNFTATAATWKRRGSRCG
jgi:hypothetical protein